MLEAIDLSYVIPTSSTPEGKKKGRDPDILDVPDQAHLVDRMAVLKMALDTLQTRYNMAARELRARCLAPIIEEVAQGREVMNAHASGTRGDAYVVVRANARPAAAGIADALARDFGRYVYRVLDTETTAKITKWPELKAAAEKAGFDLAPYVKETTVTKPQPFWPERLAKAGLPADVVRGIFNLLFTPGHAKDKKNAIAYDPQVTVKVRHAS